MAIGLDFGTTNSAIAFADREGSVRLGSFADGAGSTPTFRSVIYFPAKEPGSTAKPRALSGPAAIRTYLEAEHRGRLVLSIKSYLASRVFTETRINGRGYKLEDLISIILREIRTSTEAQFVKKGSKVVVGRPVRFSGAENAVDEQFAMERLKTAVEQAGFDNISFEFEPIAAAYKYESRLDHDELVLIGDFGGGTSDFSLIKLGPSRRSLGHDRRDILGTDGIAIAGDTFDGRIMMNLVAPWLGLGSHYRSLGKKLNVPVWIYSQLGSWHLMSFLKNPHTMRVLREVKSQAEEPEKIEALIQIVDDGLGYKLYRTVEQTKVGLSETERARFRFEDAFVDIREEIERWQFESWIQPEIQAIAACVDQLLSKCSVSAGDVDSVFLTGGSSFVPVVRRFFARKFGADRLRSGDELTSVAQGLALCALDK
jgi:hypothetical chaperone protein